MVKRSNLIGSLSSPHFAIRSASEPLTNWFHWFVFLKRYSKGNILALSRNLFLGVWPKILAKLLQNWHNKNNVFVFVPEVCHRYKWAMSRPLKSHDFAVRLTVYRTILWSHDQLRKSHCKQIHKFIHKLFLNFWFSEIQQPRPLFFEGLDTTIHIWKTKAL